MKNPAATHTWHWLDPDFDDRAVQREVQRAIAAGEVTPPSWTWPTPKSYQGATGAERVAGWKLTWCAVRLGLIPQPEGCSICGIATGRIELHSEDYSRPMLAKPVCRSCHRRIHLRFKHPASWRRLVEEHRYPGAWFETISLEEITPKKSVSSAAQR